MEGEPDVIPLNSSRGGSRVFLVISKPENEDLIEARVDQFLGGPWARQCLRVGVREARPRTAPRQPGAGARLLEEAEPILA